MKRLIALFLAVVLCLSIGITAFAEVPSKLEPVNVVNLNYPERTVLRALLSLAKNQVDSGLGWPMRWPVGSNDAINLTELTSSEIDSVRESATREGEKDFVLEAYPEKFTSADRISFCSFMTVQDIARTLEWTATQHHNPEIMFNADKKEVSAIHLYLNYYGRCTKEEARWILEEWTDIIISILPATMPTINIEAINVNWKIPAINKDSYYAATYFCREKDGAIIRGDGGGLIY